MLTLVVASETESVIVYIVTPVPMRVDWLRSVPSAWV